MCGEQALEEVAKAAQRLAGLLAKQRVPKVRGPAG